MADNNVRIRASLEDKVSKNLDKIRDGFDRLGGKGGAASFFGNVGAKAVAVGFDLISKAADVATDFIIDSNGKASDLNETLAKSSVVFGDNAGEIEEWGDTAARTFGTSKNDAINAAASFADLFKTVGLGATPSKDMSKNIVQLSADLASFHNVAGGSTEVLEKLRSGLSGEAEPLRRLNVFMTEAKVKAKAMELGLGSAHGELTEGDKILARYQIILDETKTAQGDFARTSEDLANKQRTANAVLEDNQAVLGEKMLPAQLAVTNAQIDFFTGLNALSDAIGGKLTPESIALSAALGGMTEAQAGAAIATLQTAAAAEESAKAYAEWENNRGLWTKAATDLGEALPEALEQGKAKAITIARATPEDIASALLEKRNKWQQSLDAIRQDAENSLTRTAEIAKLKSLLASAEMDKGLRSKDASVRAHWVSLRNDANTRLQELSGVAAVQSEKTASSLSKALKKHKPGTKAHADLLAIQVKNALGTLPSSAYGWGKGIGREFAQGITNKIPAVANAAQNMVEAAGNYLQILSPAKKGPFSGVGPEGFGRNLALDFAKGMASGAPDIEEASSRLMGSANGMTWDAEVGPETRALALAAGWTNGETITTKWGNTYQTMNPPANATYSPVSIPVLIDGRKVAEVVDENLFYRRMSAPR